jgi:imidazole glycerol-phosphate synthase subunit HisH
MSDNNVVVIDYGAGNVLNVKRAFEKLSVETTLTSEAEVILHASHIILPGVGAFHTAMQQLSSLGLVDSLIQASNRGVPILGICLGMQLLLDKSDEFCTTEGLGIIPGRVIPIPNKDSNSKVVKIPHIGWNELVPFDDKTNWEGSLLGDYSSMDAVYFVHSFMADLEYNQHRLADCTYGGYRIPAVISKDNTIGCQFHPEKSGMIGLNMLRNFLML